MSRLKTARISISTIIIIAIIIFSLAVIIVGPRRFFGPSKGSVSRKYLFKKGFKERMEKQADIKGIRKWLETVNKTGESIRYKTKITWPKPIKNLYPNDLQIIYYEELDLYFVKLYWGSGFGHWGLIVGQEDMELPLEEYDSDGLCEIREILEAGVYIWKEIQ